MKGDAQMATPMRESLMWVRGPIALCCALMLFAQGAMGQAGRDENIRVRQTPYVSEPMRSGPYPEGEALPEREVDGGVEIAGQVIPQSLYDEFKRSGYVPVRRELTDEELLDALRPELRARLRTGADVATYARQKFADYQPFLYWGFRRPAPGQVISQAQTAYDATFAPDGSLRLTDLAGRSPDTIGMLRWGGSYWNTGDEKWARAVKDAYLPFYHANRPPLNRVVDAKAGGMWRVLGAAARTPFLVESYAYVHASEAWSDRDHLDFWKSMLEHARYLRYTSVPVGPWPEYNPFGYGNWVLYQLQGLLSVAAYFPEFAESDDWLAHATLGIGQHGDWVVMPDSGFDEYSYSYASQVAGQMEYCYNTFAACGLPFPPRFEANMLRLHELFLKLALPGGQRVPFGDTARGGDAGASACRWAALAFLDGRFRYFAGDVSQEYIDAGARVLHPTASGRNPGLPELTPVPPEATSHILPEPGWVIMRSDWSDDATVVACPYRASDRVFHSGWEMSSFNLWRGGEPLLTKLLGFAGYMSGYPEGFGRTPLQANQVIVKGATLRRVAGSLRNWHSSADLDYLHVDHRGWGDGELIARRRLLFLKPDYLLIIDDIEGPGAADVRWQAHTDQVAPEIAGRTAVVRRERATALVTSADAALSIETHPVAGRSEVVHLLVADKSGDLPLRFITLVQVRGAALEDAASLQMALAADAVQIAFGPPGRSHTVAVEPAKSIAGRFVAWTGPDGDRFFAGDGNSSPGLARLLEAANTTAVWNGRALHVVAGEASPPLMAAELDAATVEAFGYHGRPEMTPVGVAARVLWRTEQPARHSVLYRPVGADTWQRQFQPDLFNTAWVLLPDLTPGTEYELIATSETEVGEMLVSPILRRLAPAG